MAAAFIRAEGIILTAEGHAAFRAARHAWCILSISRDPGDRLRSADYWWTHCEEVLADLRRHEPADDSRAT